MKLTKKLGILICSALILSALSLNVFASNSDCGYNNGNDCYKQTCDNNCETLSCDTNDCIDNNCVSNLFLNLNNNATACNLDMSFINNILSAWCNK